MLWTRGLIDEASRALAGARVSQQDFGQALRIVRQGDFVYCDPTYTAAHNNNGFVRYNERSFSWRDQLRLARLAENARGRGALVMVSNACHLEVRRLYPTAEVYTVSRWSGLCPEPGFRRRTDEYLFVLRPPPL